MKIFQITPISDLTISLRWKMSHVTSTCVKDVYATQITSILEVSIMKLPLCHMMSCFRQVNKKKIESNKGVAYYNRGGSHAATPTVIEKVAVRSPLP